MFLFTQQSSNRKTGPIPVTTTTPDSCPNSCAFKASGCYAKGGILRIWWERSKTGIDKQTLFQKIREIAPNALWRHNQAGDLLKNKDETINRTFLNGLVKANKGKRGFTYTHHSPYKKRNREAIAFANKEGFTINLSANNLQEADSFVKLGIAPVVTVLHENVTKDFFTPGGSKVIICPATLNKSINCMNCGFCQKAKRKFIVGFPAHGSAKRTVSKIASQFD